MTLDEKILSYLDGSLSDSESAELMHSLSVSPEKRVVFEQFVQLQTLTASASKPYDVPASVESALALKIPALAVDERERRGGFILFNSARHQLYRWAAVLLAIIVISGIWYLSRTQSEHIGIDLRVSPDAPVLERSTTQSSPIAPSENAPVHTGSIATRNDRISSLAAETLQTNALVGIRGSSELIFIPDKYDAPIEQYRSQTDPITAVDPSHLTVTNASFPLRPIRDLPIIQRGNYSRPAHIPIAIRFFGNLFNQSYIRERIGNDYFVRTELSLLAGVDYMIDEQFSVGFEFGQAAIAHINGTQQIDKTGGVIGITSGSSIESSNHWYLNAMARYLFFPESFLRVETSIGGGISLDHTTTPIIAASLMGVLPLSEKMHFYGGLNFAGSFTQVVEAASSDLRSAPEYLPRGFTTTSIPSNQTVFTPTYTFRAGIRFAPW